MINVKNKEKFLKETKEDSYLHGSSHKTVSWFLNRNISGQKGLAWNIHSDEKQKHTTKTILLKKGYHLKLEK